MGKLYTVRSIGYAGVLAIVAMAACVPPAKTQVEFLEPAASVTTGSDDAVAVTIEISETYQVEDIVFYVDGERDPVRPDLPSSKCLSACTVTWLWDTTGVTEGDHVLMVEVVDARGEINVSSQHVRLTDLPAVLITSPAAGEKNLGLASVEVEFQVTDRSPVEVEIFLEGVKIGSDRTPDSMPGCAPGCAMSHTLDTLAYDDGAYNLEIIATDIFGNAGTGKRETVFTDIIYISSIEVEESDGTAGGTTGLEIEAHLFDDNTGERLGCSGPASGLRSVDVSGRRYNVLAYFQDLDDPATPLTFEQLRGRRLYVHVIENDAYECPGDKGVFDDSVGRSPPFSASSLPGGPMQFERVNYLQFEVGRPFE